jgi:hypothetical protein
VAWRNRNGNHRNLFTSAPNSQKRELLKFRCQESFSSLLGCGHPSALPTSSKFDASEHQGVKMMIFVVSD